MTALVRWGLFALLLFAALLLVQEQAGGGTGDAFFDSPWVFGAAVVGLMAAALVGVYVLAAIKKRDEGR